MRVQLLGSFVLTGCAAGLTVHKPVSAEADIYDRLAKAAVFFAFAAVFGFLALRAAISGRTGSSAHGANVSWRGCWLK